MHSAQGSHTGRLETLDFEPRTFRITPLPLDYPASFSSSSSLPPSTLSTYFSDIPFSLCVYYVFVCSRIYSNNLSFSVFLSLSSGLSKGQTERSANYEWKAEWDIKPGL